MKERGESLRPKDKKLVKWLTDSIEAHKRNLSNFKFDMYAVLPFILQVRFFM